MQHSSEQVSFYCHDGYALTGQLYPASSAIAHIIVAGATGVPQQFYKHFARFAQAQGFSVLTFDYRGVAASAPAQLKHFVMSCLDWGEYDLAAAIDYMATDELPLFIVGHSFGGQALGLAHNHHRVTAMYCFGTGAGWHGYMPLAERIKIQVFWQLVFPPLVKFYGYLPWQKLGMGADLPAPLFYQWKRWCNSPIYFFSDPECAHLKQRYAQVKTTIYAVSAMDDAWALPPSRQAFMQHYTRAPYHAIDLHAEQYGLKHIGHMGYFRAQATAIWQDMLNTLSTHSN
mgnify:CR=1 FL=1